MTKYKRLMAFLMVLVMTLGAGHSVLAEGSYIGILHSPHSESEPAERETGEEIEATDGLENESPEIIQDENLYIQREFRASPRHFVYYETVVGTGNYMDSVSSLDESYRVKDAEATGVANEWFTLTGWNTEPDGSGASYKPGEKVSLTGNLVLYAQWEFAGAAGSVSVRTLGARASLATIAYANSYDGASSADNGIEVGSAYSVKSPAALGFTYPGQYFKYWSTDPYDVSGTRYNPGDEIQISGNLILHAIWTSDPTIVYGVIYVDQLGNYRDMGNVLPNTDIVLKSSEELGFANPGFYFDGWYLTDDYTGPVYSPGDTLTITSNTMLYAKWSLQPTKTYGLTFFSFEGGSEYSWGKAVQGLPLYSTYTFVSPLDMGMTNPPPDRTFDHWNTAQDGSGDKYYAGDSVTINDLVSGMRLYAQWVPLTEQYAVKYEANGGTGSHTDSNRNGVTPYQIKDAMEIGISRIHYTFTSWNTAADGSGTSYAPAQVITLAGDMTLYAQWEYTGPLYTVYYDANGGIGSYTDSNLQADISYMIKDTAATGISSTNYTFTSWNTAADGSGTSYAPAQGITLAGDMTLYAQWTYSGSLYAVAYEANGGTGAYADTGLQADVPYIVKDAAATGVSRTHYSFVSWNTAADGSGTSYAPAQVMTLTGDVTLYAQWTYSGSLYAVAYEANGGTGAYADTGLQADVPYIVKDAAATGVSRTHYSFVSWNMAADGSGTEYLPGDSINLTGDVTLYAQWEYAGPLYAVHYDANGGTGSHTDSDLRGDMPYIIKDTTAAGISKASYTFVSWNTAADGSGTSYAPAQGTTLTGDMTLYAQWELNPNIVNITVHHRDKNASADLYTETLTVPKDITVEIPFMGFAGYKLAEGQPEIQTVLADADKSIEFLYEKDGTGLENELGTVIVKHVDKNNAANVLATESFNIKVGESFKPQEKDFAGWTVADKPEEFIVEKGIVEKVITYENDGGIFEIPHYITVHHKLENTNGLILASDRVKAEKGASFTAEKKDITGYKVKEGYAPIVISPVENRDYILEIFYEMDYVTITVHHRNIAAPVNDLYTDAIKVQKGRTITVNARTISNFRLADGQPVSRIVLADSDKSLEFLYAAITGGGGNGGGGGGGTQTPEPEPIVEIEEEVVPLGLQRVEHIQYVYGYPDGTFGPDQWITRAEAASIFHNLLIDVEKTGYQQSFYDVKAGEWYSDAVNCLAGNDVLVGYPDGSFRPDQFITRAEFATLASKFDKLSYSDTNIFLDVAEDHWALKFINSAAVKGWVKGYGNGQFKPEQSITRAEVVALVNAVLDRKVALEDILKDAKIFSDISPDHWAYTNIVEASNEHTYSRKENNFEIWYEIIQK